MNGPTDYAILEPPNESTDTQQQHCCHHLLPSSQRFSLPALLSTLLTTIVILTLLILFSFGVIFTPTPPPLHNVLIVVDMQNDYCSECNSPTVSKWALTGLPDVAHHINLLHNSNSNSNSNSNNDQVTISQVVFTQDWLPDSSTFLRRNTYGAEIIRALEQPEGSLTFTKSSDDWMNRLGPKEKCTYCDPSYDDNYHFSLNNEKGSTTTNPNGGRPTLDQYLTSAGYPPAETRLIVTGIAENRCVMKGSIHALDLGYKDVVLYFPGKSF